MLPSIAIDQSQGPLVVIRFHSAPTDQQFQQYLADYWELLRRHSRLGAVFVTAPDLPMMPARRVRMQAEFIREHRELMTERAVCIAFALPSPLMRSVLRAILMLQPMPCPHTVVGTESEGVSWVKARLWTDHVRRMKGAPA